MIAIQCQQLYLSIAPLLNFYNFIDQLQVILINIEREELSEICIMCIKMFVFSKHVYKLVCYSVEIIIKYNNFTFNKPQKIRIDTIIKDL